MLPSGSRRIVYQSQISNISTCMISHSTDRGILDLDYFRVSKMSI
jgi:hypothetical protein